MEFHPFVCFQRKRNPKIPVNEPNTTCQISIMLLIFTLTLAVPTVKAMRGLPPEILRSVMENSSDQTMNSLSQLSKEWNKYCMKEMEKRRVADKVQLVNKVERFLTKFSRHVEPYISQMDAREEIEHYLNGFDLRMHDGMSTFHSKSDNVMKQQIEEFASKLAQHQATYSCSPLHRRGDQGAMPLFDAFIRMRDNNMKILQGRMRRDDIMFAYRVSDGLVREHQAVVEMMKILETIGMMIGYPGVQEMMQQNGKWFGFSRRTQQGVRKLLFGTADITQWQYQLQMRNLVQILSKDSCIGREATDEIVGNIRVFIREYREYQDRQQSLSTLEHQRKRNFVFLLIEITVFIWWVIAMWLWIGRV